MHKWRVITFVVCLLLLFVVSVGRWQTARLSPAAPSPAREQVPPPTPTTTVTRDAVEQFTDWTQSFQTGAAADVAEGIELAKARREWMAELIRTNPKRALEVAVPMAVRAQLPASVLEQLEERVSGRGSYGVLIATDFERGTSEVRREVVINGKRYDAFVYGQRLAQVTRENIPMYGVAVGNWLALAESSVRLLEAGEPIPLGAQDQLCVVSARPAISYQTPAYAEIGGVVESFCGPRHVEVYAERLAADQGSVGQSAGEPPTAQESWSQGPKTCLFMRVNFPDDPTEPITEDGAYALMDGVNLFFVENSYDTTSIIPTVTPLLMMPQTKAYYTLQGTGRLMSDARQAAREAGYDTDNYHWDIVRNTSVPGFNFGGLAFVHGKGTWLQSSSVGVAAHEVGHNYGLWHANSWNAIGESVYGIGTHSEYGNSFDTMGAASGGNNHFNAAFKHQLDWLPETFVHNVTADGTYRIYTFDLPNVVPGQKYAFRVKKNYDRNYWGEFRQKFTSNRWFNNGVILNWDPWNNGVDESAGGTHLLDTTPGSPDGKNDGAVVIGRTFSDLAAGVHITPIARSPASEPPWIDTVVNIGFYPANNPPVATLIADRATAPVNTVANFFVQAVDDDSDPLAYAWEFGDGTFGPNQPNVSKSWAGAGEYTVRCTISDMKGGVYSKHTLVRVGNPNVMRASGRVLNAEGVPVEGVRVHNGASGTGYRGTFTDSDGYYILANLAAGSATLSAAKYGYTLAQDGWNNPIGGSTNVTGLDWIATPLPVVSIVAVDGAASEAGLNAGHFVLARTGPTNEALVVKFNRSGSASSGSDYTNNPALAGSPLSLTIPIGRDSIEVRVHPMPDSVGEGPELATLTLMEDATYVMGQAEASVTIADDDAAGIPSIDVSASTPSELADNLASETGPDNGVFTFTRNGSTANEITVLYSVTGTATAGVDYTALPGVVVIPAGQRVTTVPFTVIDDLAIEPDETVIVTILANAAYSGAGDSTTVTLIDDDPPRVTITATDDVAREAGASPGAFTITRQGNLGANLVVNYTVAGTALSGEDFLDLPGTITIPAGRATATLTVTPLNDPEIEIEETVQVMIASAAAYNVGNPGGATVVIVDDESASVSLSASDSSATEAAAGTGAFQFTRTGPTTSDLTVFYDALGTALNGIDYQSVSGSIVIPTGSATATLTIVPIDDAFVEGSETVRLVLLPSLGYSLGTTSPQTVNIADNDSGLPSVGFTFTQSSGSEGITPARISLSLGASSASSVTVNYAVTGGSATGGNIDFNLASGTATFPAGVINTNIAVIITADALVETNETIRITLSNPSGAVLNTDTATHTFTIIDDDGSGAISVAALDASASETGPDPAVFRITRSVAATNDLTVYYQVVGSASAPSDFDSIPGSVVIPANSTAVSININPVDDATEELDETVIINILSAPNYRIGTENATITIADNDDSSGLPVVSIVADDASASEPGTDTGVFRISRTGDTTDALMVQFTVGGTAAAADFPALGTTKIIPAGESEAVLVVTPNDDAAFETNETVVVTLTLLSTYKVATPAATVTIIDNEIGVSIAADGTASEEGSTGSFVLTRTGSTLANLSVSLTAAGTATPAIDYTGLTSPVTIPAGQAQLTIPIAAVNDPTPEGPETITATITAGAGYTVTQPNSATLLLIDDEPAVSIVANDPDAGEGGGNSGQFTITRSGNTNAALTVSLGIGGTASNGVDFVTLEDSVVIPAGQVSLPINVVAIDDPDTEGNETVQLTVLADVAYAVTPPNTALVTIIDDEINLVPTVVITSPGADTIYLVNTNSMLVLEALVTDDGRPNPPGQTTVSWTRAGGTGNGFVTFGTPFQATTTAAFSANGIYILRVTANDSQFSNSDDLTVVVGGQGSLDTGLMANWKFDETNGLTALDSSGNNRNAAVSGAAIVGGRYGNARDFDGLDDTAAFTSPALTRFTLTAWVQSDTRGESTTPRVIAMPGYNVRIRRDTASTFDCLAMESQRSTTSGEWRTGQSTIVDGPWHHIAVVYDSASTANNPVFYINGVLQPTTVRTAPSGTQAANNGTGYIGNSAAGDRTYDGRIDEMRLYNRLLSSNEVALLAAEPPTNVAAVVDAGPAQFVPVATPLVLDGTVTDDGNIAPVITTWSKVSGPGEVIFGEPSDVDDTVTFNTPGMYVLRLLADDGQVKTADHVTIQVTGPTAVNLVATDDEAGELPGGGEGTGALLLVRSGDLSAPITVYLSFAGTASNGVDYTALPTAVLMPPGQSNRVMLIQPRVDGLPEGTETIEVSLLEDPAYNLGSSMNASLLLFDQPYDDWRYAHFTAAELLDPLVSGPAADPEADGINNFLEYAFFLDPRNPSIQPSLDPSIEAGDFTVAYHRRKAPTDVNYQIERSNDLVSWTPTELIVSVTDDGNGVTETVKDRDTVPFPAPSGSRFVRLRVRLVTGP